MKKLRKILIVFVLVIISCVGLISGCQATLKGGPDKNDAITSNGKLVVQKGNYLYFVNGYVSASSNNKSGQVDNGAIYRAKLTNNKLSYDDNGNLIDCERVVSKIAGFENGGIYIFGNTLYYASPNTEKNRSDGKVDTNLLDFYKVNLNGSGNSRIYKSTVSSSSTQFAFYEIDKTVYLVVYDTEKVVVVNCSNSKQTIVSENVSSAILPVVENNNPANNTISNVESRVYYTRSAKDGEENTGKVMCYASINDASNEVVVSGLNPSLSYNLKQLSYSSNEDNAYIVYTTSETGTELYYASKIVNEEIDMSSQVKLTTKAQSNNVYLYTDNSAFNSQKGIITTNANGYLTLITLSSNYIEKSTVYENLGKIAILDVKGNVIFYKNEDNQVFMVALNNEELNPIQLTNSNNTYNFDANVNFDINGEYVYIYKTYTGDNDSSGNAVTGNYLIRIKYQNASSYEEELVGKVLAKHIKTETEE